MRYWNLIAILLSLTILPRFRATAQASDAKPDLGANAAVKYWQAFALLPTLDKDQEKLVQEWNKVPLDAAARKVIDGFQGSREYLHRGAKLEQCDWGLDYEDGIRLLLPHGPRSMNLARLAALDARHEFEQAHWQTGWEDVTALLKLARHVETDPIMINQLVGYRIEAIAIDAAAPYLPELKPVINIIPKPDAGALKSLPTKPTLQQMVLMEKRLGPVWLIKELTKAEQHKQGSWRDLWKEIFDAPGEGEQPRRDLVQSAKTFEQAIKMMEETLSLHDELAEMTTLPWKEFDARYPEFVKKAGAVNKPAAYILPNMAKIVPAQRRNQTQLAMFKAALAVIQGGEPDKLKEIKDPFGDGPFEYRALDKGFELKSKLIFNGQPVMLTVGKGK